MDRILGGLIRYAPYAHQLAGPPAPILRGGLVSIPHIQTVLDGFAGYTLRGKVTRNGTPAALVRVWLFDRMEPSALRLTRSDAQGNYRFKPLRPSPRGYVVLGFDDTGALDPEAKDFLQPVEAPAP